MRDAQFHVYVPRPVNLAEWRMQRASGRSRPRHTAALTRLVVPEIGQPAVGIIRAAVACVCPFWGPLCVWWLAR